MSIKDHRKKIKLILDNCIDDLTDYMVQRLVAESPIQTGDFIESHVAEPEPRSYPRLSAPSGDPKGLYGFEIKSPERESYIKAKVYKELRIAAKKVIHETGKVSINNKAEHANFVEYLGWIPFGGRTPPYFPFAKTKGDVTLRKKMILSQSKHVPTISIEGFEP